MIELNQSHGLAAGSDLWVTAGLQQSKWSRRIDWYLNLQLLKAERYQPQKLVPEVQRILDEDVNWTPPEFAKSNSDLDGSLMVGVQMQIPARKLIVLPFEKLDSWTHRIFQVWSELKSPVMRIFLPDDITTGEFHAHWPDSHGTETVSLVGSERT